MRLVFSPSLIRWIVLLSASIFCCICEAQTSPTVRVNSLAELQTLTIPAITTKLTALVAGRNSAGDGAGATLWWYDTSDSTTPGNGGTIVVGATGKRWKMMFVGPVYPEWFGAVSGQDSTSAFQTIASNDFREVRGRSGSTYLLSDTITWSRLGSTASLIQGKVIDFSGCVIKGIANGSGAFPTNLFYFPSNSGTNNLYNTEVANILFDGTVQNSFLAFDASYMWYCNIHDIRTSFGATASSLVEANNASAVNQGGLNTFQRLTSFANVTNTVAIVTAAGGINIHDDYTITDVNNLYTGNPRGSCLYVGNNAYLLNCILRRFYSGQKSVCIDGAGVSYLINSTVTDMYSEPAMQNCITINIGAISCSINHVRMFYDPAICTGQVQCFQGQSSGNDISHLNQYDTTGSLISTTYYHELASSDYNVLLDIGSNPGVTVSLDAGSTHTKYLTGDSIHSVIGNFNQLIANTGLTVGLTNGAAKLHVFGGDDDTVYGTATVALGYKVAGRYPHFIHTQHSGTAAENYIDFYTSDGTASGTFPANAVFGATINAGRLGVLIKNPKSTLESGGSFGINVTTGNAFQLTSTNGVYLVNVDAQTIVLPTPVGIKNRIYSVKTIAPANTATVSTVAGTIDGSATYSLTASNKFVTVISDNTDWRIIGQNGFPIWVFILVPFQIMNAIKHWLLRKKVAGNV